MFRFALASVVAGVCLLAPPQEKDQPAQPPPEKPASQPAAQPASPRNPTQARILEELLREHEELRSRKIIASDWERRSRVLEALLRHVNEGATFNRVKQHLGANPPEGWNEKLALVRRAFAVVHRKNGKSGGILLEAFLDIRHLGRLSLHNNLWTATLPAARDHIDGSVDKQDQLNKTCQAGIVSVIQPILRGQSGEAPLTHNVFGGNSVQSVSCYIVYQ